MATHLPRRCSRIAHGLRVLACCALAGIGAAQNAASSEGARAPAGAWLVLGGALSRSGASASLPLRAPYERAWEYVAGAAIEGEPLALAPDVWLEVRRADGARRIELVDLATGARSAASEWFESGVPLTPALCGKRLALRSSERDVVVLERAGRSLVPVGAVQHAQGAAAPLLVEDELYLRVGEGLERRELGRSAPSWRVEGRFRGELALLGDEVYALHYDEAGNAELRAYERTSGRMRPVGRAGHHEGALPEYGAPLELALLAFDSALLGQVLPLSGQREPALVSIGALGTRTLPALGMPAAFGAGWIGMTLDPAGAPCLLRVDDALGERTVVLASTNAQPQFLVPGRSPAIASEVAYLAGGAVELPSGRVLHGYASTPRARPVPLGCALLTVDAPTRLSAWRTQRAPAAFSLSAFGEPGDVLGVERALGLWWDGARAEGELVYDSARDRLGPADARRGAPRPLLELDYLEDADGEVLHASTPALAVAAIARLHEASSALARVYAERAASLAELEAPGVQPALLAAALALDPVQPQARAQLAALLPPELSGLEQKAALEYALAASLAPIAPAAAQDEFAQQALRTQRSSWRSDLLALRCGELVLLAPRSLAGAAASSLLRGRRALAVLEQVLAPLEGTSAAQRPENLLALLYANHGEYVEQGGGALGEHGALLARTQGHYDAEADLARLHLPEDPRERDALWSTYAHELVHHALRARWAPAHAGKTGNLRAPSALGMDARSPGYWVVEGLAVHVEELCRAHELADPDSTEPRALASALAPPLHASLDVVARAPASALVPWELLYGASENEFSALEERAPASFAPIGALGTLQRLSVHNLFYAQGGASCAHLLSDADAGSARALLSYARAWYRGERAELDVQRAFGRTAHELGEAVRAHALALQPALAVSAARAR